MLDKRSQISLSLTCWKYYAILGRSISIKYKYLSLSLYSYLFIYHELTAIILGIYSDDRALYIIISISSAILPVLFFFCQDNRENEINCNDIIKLAGAFTCCFSIIWFIIIGIIALCNDTMILLLIIISFGIFISIIGSIGIIYFYFHYRSQIKHHNKIYEKYYKDIQK